MSGGSISANTGIGTNGSDQSAVANVNISGGSVSAPNDVAIYQPRGSFTISGGTLTGATAIYTKCTNLTITGGTISGTGTLTAFKHSGNGCVATGDAIVIENTTGYQDSPIIDIRTGTGYASISSTNAYEVALYQFGTPDEQTEIKTLILGSGVDCKIAASEGSGNTKSTIASVFTTSSTGSIVLGSGSTLTNNGVLTNNGSFVNMGTFTNSGTFSNSGVFIEEGTTTGWTKTGNVLNLVVNPSASGTISATVSGTTVAATATAASGYGFAYWTDGTNTDPNATKSISVSGVMTWTAVFGTSVTATFDSQGGSSVASQTVGYNSMITEPADPTRSGYSFAGWYTDTEYGTKWDFTTKVTQDITLYAKWDSSSAAYFTVTFMKDSTTTYSTAKVESGKMASAPSTDPTVSGSRFLGWYTTAGVTSITAEKFDFSTMITADLTLYAGWIATCTIALPDSVENCTLSVYGTNTVNVSAGSFSFTVTPADNYTATVTVTQNGEDSVTSNIAVAQTITITDLSCNAAVYVMLTATDGSYTETSKTVTENTDGTTTTINTKVETSASGDVAITETTSTTDSESTTTKTEATIKDATATLKVETTDTDVAKVTETIVYAITEATDSPVDIGVTVSTKTIELPKAILNNDDVRSLTVTVNSGSANSATISIPTDVLYSGDMADTISLSVTSSPSKPQSSALKGSSAISAFDLGLTGTNTTTFNSPVSIAYDVTLPTGASNVRAYCIDTGEFVKASYKNGAALFSVPHFSAWTLVYDEPTVIVEDDDDILFILEQQRKAQEAASSQTTTDDNSGEEAAVIIAAAAVAGAMLACAFFAFRRP